MRSIIALPNDYVVVDIETTGLNSQEDDIIELAAIRYRNGEEIERFSQLVAVDYPLSQYVSSLTGITDEMLVGKPHIDEVIHRFAEFIGDDILIGHNIASFDTCFINQAYVQYLGKELSNSCVDTMRLCKKLHPQASIKSLKWLAWHYGIPYENAHRGASDCSITHACYQEVRKEILDEHSEEEFLQLCDKRAPKRKISDIKPTSEISPASPLYQEVIVFTGGMDITREEAMQIAVNAGAIVRGSVTSKTTYLVSDNPDISHDGAEYLSTKEKRALELNKSGKAHIQFITGEEFLKLAGKGDSNMSVAEPAREYRSFTKPAELHKAINTLRGIVAGISCNDGVSTDEIHELTHWCSLHAHLRDRHPFSELLPVIESSIQDGRIDEEEQQDILWLCGNFVGSASYYDAMTSSIQFLNGLVHGIMADHQLGNGEIDTLKLWLDTNDFLQGTYPFDELSSMVHTIVEDKVITDEERNSLLAFMSNLVEFKDSYNLVEADFAELRRQYSVGGICAYCPDVEIKGKLFCFTGESYRSTRSEIKAEVERLGGSFRNSVSKNTDYLVVGNAGNPCWAYSCYGRKIEEAMALRKAGAKLQIINETDFWDAIWDSDI